MQHHVFLSYSRKDTPVMERVRDSLRADGLTVWTDENLNPGTPEWEPLIERAIREAGCIIALLSPDFKDSRWCAIELTTADDLKRTIFPLLIRGTDADAVPLRLKTTQRVNAIHDLNAGIQKTIEAVCRHLNTESVSMRAQREREEEALRQNEAQRREQEALREQERQRRLAEEAEIERLKEIERQRLREQDEVKRQARIQEEARKRAAREHRRFPRALRNGCLALLVLGILGGGGLTALALYNQQQDQQRLQAYRTQLTQQAANRRNPTTAPTSDFNAAGLFDDFASNNLLHIGCDESGGGGDFPVNSTITLYENIVGATASDARWLSSVTSFATYINSLLVTNWSESGPNSWRGTIPGYGAASGYSLYYSAPITLQSPGVYYSYTTYSRTEPVFNGFLTYYAGTFTTSCTFTAS